MDKRIVRLPIVMTVLLICVLSMSSLFADGSIDMAFNIVHFINIDSRYEFIFKDSSSETVSAISLEVGEANDDFASLYLQHNSNMIIKSLTVVATDLETSDHAATYPYTMTLADAQGNTIPWVEDENGHGSGYALLVSKTTVFRYKDTGGEVKLADFSIDLRVTEEVASGNYEGTITLYYVVI